MCYLTEEERNKGERKRKDTNMKKTKNFILLGFNILLLATIAIGTISVANNHADTEFWHEFKVYESKYTVNFGEHRRVEKADNSSSYVKCTLNRFYVESIRLQDYGKGIKKSSFPKMHLSTGQEMVGSSTVRVGQRAVPRIEKGASLSTPYVKGLFSPDNYQGYTDTRRLN